MIRPLIVAFAIGLCVTLSAQTSQPPSPSRSNAGQQQQQQSGRQQAQPAIAPQISPSIPVPVQQTPIAPTAQNPPGNTPNQNQQTTPDWVTWASGLSNVVIAAFTIVLALVAIWQIGYMRDGLIETRKSADAANASADSIKLLNRQWVNFEDWKANQMTEIQTRRVHLWINVHVMNKTNYPLDFLHLETKEPFTGPSPHWPKTMLAPGEAIWCQFGLALNEKATPEMLSDGSIHQFFGVAHFIDIHGDKQAQPFSRVCTFHDSGPITFGPGMITPERSRMTKPPFTKASEKEGN